MFPAYQILEFVAYEQHKDWQKQAEQRRLIRMLRQPSTNQALSRKGRHWIGSQLVKWGLKLQGCTKVRLTPDTRVANAGQLPD